MTDLIDILARRIPQLHAATAREYPNGELYEVDLPTEQFAALRDAVGVDPYTKELLWDGVLIGETYTLPDGEINAVISNQNERGHYALVVRPTRLMVATATHSLAVAARGGLAGGEVCRA